MTIAVYQNGLATSLSKKELFSFLDKVLTGAFASTIMIDKQPKSFRPSNQRSRDVFTRTLVHEFKTRVHRTRRVSGRRILLFNKLHRPFTSLSYRILVGCYPSVGSQNSAIRQNDSFDGNKQTYIFKPTNAVRPWSSNRTRSRKYICGLEEDIVLIQVILNLCDSQGVHPILTLLWRVRGLRKLRERANACQLSY